MWGGRAGTPDGTAEAEQPRSHSLISLSEKCGNEAKIALLSGRVQRLEDEHMVMPSAVCDSFRFLRMEALSI